MKKIAIIFLFFFLAVTPFATAQQTLQLTTYYPAPYGAYQRIIVGENVLITPQDNAHIPTCDAAQEGSIFVGASGSTRPGTNLCQGGSWVPVGGWSTRKAGNRPITYVMDPTGTAGEEPHVGIGTSDPQRYLHLLGDQATIRVEDDGGPQGEITATDNAVQIGARTADKILFVTTDPVGGADPNRMCITGEGKVGIGTTDPSANLEVANSFVLNNTNADGAAEMIFRTTTSAYSIKADPNPLDPAYDNSLIIDVANNTNPTQPPTVVIKQGDVVINGVLSIKGPSDPEAEVKVKYVEDAGIGGYYATYAP